MKLRNYAVAGRLDWIEPEPGSVKMERWRESGAGPLAPPAPGQSGRFRRVGEPAAEVWMRASASNMFRVPERRWSVAAAPPAGAAPGPARTGSRP